MNTKERLLQEIEQAPDSLIEETLNFLLSAQSSYAKSESNVGEAILKLLEEIPLDNDDLEKLPIDLANQHDYYLYGIPKS
ncbi:MAG: hypothetical protein GPI96_19540 [Microcystis aeruginosa BS13-02]|jgi:hypothetical protein|nr:hypothetical protein [Microcystis aeruginosa BS13-02]